MGPDRLTKQSFDTVALHGASNLARDHEPEASWNILGALLGHAQQPADRRPGAAGEDPLEFARRSQTFRPAHPRSGSGRQASATLATPAGDQGAAGARAHARAEAVFTLPAAVAGLVGALHQRKTPGLGGRRSVRGVPTKRQHGEIPPLTCRNALGRPVDERLSRSCFHRGRCLYSPAIARVFTLERPSLHVSFLFARPGPADRCRAAR